MEVLGGVPQESVLGPLSFILFVQDLPVWITNSIMMFADDTRVWCQVRCGQDSMSLQTDLSKFGDWNDQ
jgi:ribonucleases P/MRP protein subunit RPP40